MSFHFRKRKKKLELGLASMENDALAQFQKIQFNLSTVSMLKTITI